MKKRSRYILITLCVLLLTGCGLNAGGETAAGTYVGQYTHILGEPESVRDTSPFTLELRRDGTGLHHRDNMDFEVTWELEGETITVTEHFLGAEISYTGTLLDRELVLFNGDPTAPWTVEYVYVKP